MAAGYRPNKSFLHSAEVKRTITPIGVAVIAAARENAPRLTGHLADSIDGEWVEDGGREVFRVAAHDFKGHWIEFGTVNMTAEPYLGPAAMDIVGNLH